MITFTSRTAKITTSIHSFTDVTKNYSFGMIYITIGYLKSYSFWIVIL